MLDRVYNVTILDPSSNNFFGWIQFCTCKICAKGTKGRHSCVDIDNIQPIIFITDEAMAQKIFNYRRDVFRITTDVLSQDNEGRWVIVTKTSGRPVRKRLEKSFLNPIFPSRKISTMCKLDYRSKFRIVIGKSELNILKTSFEKMFDKIRNRSDDDLCFLDDKSFGNATAAFSELTAKYANDLVCVITFQRFKEGKQNYVRVLAKLLPVDYLSRYVVGDKPLKGCRSVGKHRIQLDISDGDVFSHPLKIDENIYACRLYTFPVWDAKVSDIATNRVGDDYIDWRDGKYDSIHKKRFDRLSTANTPNQSTRQPVTCEPTTRKPDNRASDDMIVTGNATKRVGSSVKSTPSPKNKVNLSDNEESDDNDDDEERKDDEGHENEENTTFVPFPKDPNNSSDYSRLGGYYANPSNILVFATNDDRSSVSFRQNLNKHYVHRKNSSPDVPSGIYKANCCREKTIKKFVTTESTPDYTIHTASVASTFGTANSSQKNETKTKTSAMDTISNNVVLFVKENAIKDAFRIWENTSRKVTGTISVALTISDWGLTHPDAMMHHVSKDNEARDVMPPVQNTKKSRRVDPVKKKTVSKKRKVEDEVEQDQEDEYEEGEQNKEDEQDEEDNRRHTKRPRYNYGKSPRFEFSGYTGGKTIASTNPVNVSERERLTRELKRKTKELERLKKVQAEHYMEEEQEEEELEELEKSSFIDRVLKIIGKGFEKQFDEIKREQKDTQRTLEKAFEEIRKTQRETQNKINCVLPGNLPLSVELLHSSTRDSNTHNLGVSILPEGETFDNLMGVDSTTFEFKSLDDVLKGNESIHRIESVPWFDKRKNSREKIRTPSSSTENKRKISGLESDDDFYGILNSMKRLAKSNARRLMIRKKPKSKFEKPSVTLLASTPKDETKSPVSPSFSVKTTEIANTTDTVNTVNAVNAVNAINNVNAVNTTNMANMLMRSPPPTTVPTNIPTTPIPSALHVNTPPFPQLYNASGAFPVSTPPFSPFIQPTRVETPHTYYTSQQIPPYLSQNLRTNAAANPQIFKPQLANEILRDLEKKQKTQMRRVANHTSNKQNSVNLPTGTHIYPESPVLSQMAYNAQQMDSFIAARWNNNAFLRNPNTGMGVQEIPNIKGKTFTPLADDQILELERQVQLSQQQQQQQMQQLQQQQQQQTQHHQQQQIQTHINTPKSVSPMPTKSDDFITSLDAQTVSNVVKNTVPNTVPNTVLNTLTNNNQINRNTNDVSSEPTDDIESTVDFLIW